MRKKIQCPECKKPARVIKETKGWYRIRCTNKKCYLFRFKDYLLFRPIGKWKKEGRAYE